MKKDSDNQLFFDFDTPGCSSLPVMEAAANKDAAIVDASELPPEVELEAESADIAEAAVAVETAVEQQMIAEEQNEVQKAEKKPRKTSGNPELPLYQAVLAHLVREGVSAAALNVPCRQKKYHAPVAAYYSEYTKRLNRLSGTVVVDVYSKRCQCLPECAGAQAVARELVELKQQRGAMEAQIRIDEPHLLAEDELFDEFRSFDYNRSCNKEYHKLCRRIRSLEQSLYKGTRMEQLAKAAVADHLIIAVPENMISADEMPDNWGVWYIMPDRSIREVKAPEKQECSQESRLHLMQNIGHAALNSVLFAQGVKVDNSGRTRFTRQPRARRK